MEDNVVLKEGNGSSGMIVRIHGGPPENGEDSTTSTLYHLRTAFVKEMVV
jgi:hypothetical protein